MRWLSDSQQELVVRTIARIPIARARKDFLVKLEPRLRAKMSDEQVVEAINATLAQFEPGTYRVDAHGRVERRDDPVDPNITLKEAAERYQRLLREDPGEWAWPPYPPQPPRPPEQREIKSAPMTPEQLRAGVEEYERSWFDTDAEHEAYRRREADRKAEELASRAAWPVDPSPPPTVPEIRGEVIEHEPSPEPDDPDDEPPDPPPPRDPAPSRSQAIRETIELIKRGGKGRPRKPPVFFR